MRFRTLGMLACAILASVAWSSRSCAAQTQPIPSSDIPLNAGGVFAVTNPGISCGLGAGTVLETSQDDVRDIFGGTFGTIASDKGDVSFADNQPIGTVETVTVTLPNPVTLQNFALYLQDDEITPAPGVNARSVREFKFFAGSTEIDDLQILDDSGIQSYNGVYGGTGGAIEIQDTLVNAPASASYTLEFTQNANASGNSGLRVQEFGAFVPEPGSLALLALFFGTGLLRRRLPMIAVK